ncbi:uncharacterized protein LOC106730391 [Camelus ferus]|uniref:Uncharacterized protein LOC106730391 n=1 Tax=Camelus ferus TaxID=419612 RepID=A0A8B8TE59_CAMFR|nr:uncharacterized protein LOC106730391 [Camelus ferus]
MGRGTSEECRGISCHALTLQLPGAGSTMTLEAGAAPRRALPAGGGRGRPPAATEAGARFSPPPRASSPRAAAVTGPGCSSSRGGGWPAWQSLPPLQASFGRPAGRPHASEVGVSRPSTLRRVTSRKDGVESKAWRSLLSGRESVPGALESHWPESDHMLTPGPIKGKQGLSAIVTSSAELSLTLSGPLSKLKSVVHLCWTHLSMTSSSEVLCPL